MVAKGRTASRPRSRSRSKSRGKTPKKVNGAFKRSGQFKHDFIHTQVKKLMPLIKGKELKEKSLALAKSGYFDKPDSKTDLKSSQSEYDNLVKEIQLALGAIRAGLGDKPIRMKLTAAFSLTRTVTSGVVNSVNIGASSNGRIKPSDAAEWSSCAALFEEVKCLGGHIHFLYLATNDTATTQTANVLPTIAYDADDSTAATGSSILSQAAQHKQFGVALQVGSAGAVGAYIPPHIFHFHIPRGNVVSQSGSLPGTEWQPVATVTDMGYIKFYHVSNATTAIDVAGGTFYYDLEFRCRS